MSSCTNSTRAAEQRWPAEVNAERDRVLDHLFRQRGGVGDQRVLAAGFGDQHADRGVARGQRAVDRARGVGRAGEGDAGDARVARERGADGGAVARQELQHGFGHAGFVQQLHRVVADQVGLLGRLGDHAVAGGERRGDLAERRSPAGSSTG